MIRLFVAFLGVIALSVPLAAESAPPLNEKRAKEVREACGFPQAAIVDASGVDSVEALGARLPDRGTPQIVYGGQFEAADFSPIAAKLARTCFHSTDLSNSRWEGVTIPGLVFIRSDMAGAQLVAASLHAVRFEGVDLSSADLAETDLQGGRWVGAYWTSKLGGTNFHGARLADFVFECSIVMSESCGNEDATFAHADFTGADLTDLPVWGNDNFSAAQFDRTVLSPRALAYLDDDVGFAGPVYFYRAEDGDPAQRQVEEFYPAEIAEIRRNIVDRKSVDVPSFDCAKARTRTEQLVCGQWAQSLRDADRLLAQSYKRALADGLTNSAEQRSWLKERDRCVDEDCLLSAYRKRTEILLGRLGPVRNFRPGEQRFFTEEVLVFDPAFRSSQTYRRFVDPLRASTLQQVVLSMREGGIIDAQGTAVGGNGHMCDLMVEGARFDPANGWYSGVTDDGAMVPLFRLIGNRMEFRYSGNVGDTPDEAADFISCGARAGFVPLTDLLN